MRDKLIQLLKDLVEIEERLKQKESRSLKVIANEKYAELFRIIYLLYRNK